MIKRRKQARKKPSGFQGTERDLIRYLEGKMAPDEKRRFESLIEADPFLSDALEGLSALDKKAIPGIVFQLNAALNKQVKHRKRRSRFFFNQKLLIWLSVLILLLFILISWWYIQMIAGSRF